MYVYTADDNAHAAAEFAAKQEMRPLLERIEELESEVRHIKNTHYFAQDANGKICFELLPRPDIHKIKIEAVRAFVESVCKERTINDPVAIAVEQKFKELMER